jgi:hypothetical protein
MVEEYPHVGCGRYLLSQRVWSATKRRSSSTVGMVRHPATPSAMVSVEPVVTTRFGARNVIAGAPSNWTQITSPSGANAFST